MSHFAFFDTLNESDPESPGWELVSCGYLVMRYFDDWCSIGPAQTAMDVETTELRTKIQSLDRTYAPYANVFRSIIQALTDATDWKVFSVAAPVIAYGRLLEADSQWMLAADVYGSVADLLDQELDRDVLDAQSHAMARRRQAFALRTKGEFDEAETRYLQAVIIGDRYGDVATSHYANLGLSSLYRVRGDSKASLKVLDRMLAERALSPEQHPDGAVSEILHNRGASRLIMKDYDGAFSDLVVAYQTSANISAQDQVLSDLGSCSIRKGYYDFASLVLDLVLRRTHNNHLRQFAIFNMMALATMRGDEQAFMHFRTQWRPRDCGDVALAYAYYSLAEGMERFGTKPQARTAYRKAVRYAERMRVPDIRAAALEGLERLQS